MNIKKKSNYKARKIIKTFFKNTQQENPGLSLDDIILKFENSSFVSLDEFAKSKHRTAESYRKIYSPFLQKNMNFFHK